MHQWKANAFIFPKMDPYDWCCRVCCVCRVHQGYEPEIFMVFNINTFMYDYRKYNVNSFIAHSVVLQYVTDLKWPNNLDAMMSLICKLTRDVTCRHKSLKIPWETLNYDFIYHTVKMIWSVSHSNLCCSISLKIYILTNFIFLKSYNIQLDFFFINLIYIFLSYVSDWSQF